MIVLPTASTGASPAAAEAAAEGSASPTEAATDDTITRLRDAKRRARER